MIRISFPVRRIAILGAFLSALVLTGCKEVLYSELTEMEANEMVAVLAAGGIPSARERDKAGAYALKVENEAIADAVVILRGAGYPKQRFQSLGDVFGQEGLVGTPFEERARFMFALNEELSHTLSEINGIHSARVQVMIPAPEKFAADTRQATASVAIMVEPGFEVAPLVPSIKSLVSHSVPDLDYESVTVAVFPVDAPSIEAAVLDIAPGDAGEQQVKVRAMGLSMPGAARRLQIGFLVLVAGALVFGGLYFYNRSGRSQ